MIDNLSILVSLTGIVICVYRAVLLDKLLPWFGVQPGRKGGARVPGRGGR